MAHDAAPARVDAIAGEGAEVDPRRWLLRRRGANPAGGCGRERLDDRVGHGVAGLRADPASDHARLHADDGRSRRDQGSGIRDQGCSTQSSSRAASADCCAPSRAGAPFIWPQCKVIGVEPTSGGVPAGLGARRARRWPSTGPLTTTMAGFATAKCRRSAFVSLLPNVDAFMAIDDGWAHEAMRALAQPRGGDPAIAAGASGAAALGGLLALVPRRVDRRGAAPRLGLDRSSQGPRDRQRRRHRSRSVAHRSTATSDERRHACAQRRASHCCSSR